MKDLAIKQFIFASFLLLFSSIVNGQYSQTIKGQVLDFYTDVPLPGATVMLLDSVRAIGTTTDIDGYFSLPDIPVGRQGVSISYLGYHTAVLSDLYLQSGKELILEVKLEEKAVQLEGVTVSAHIKDKTLNEMAQVSARMFTVEETERYAGSFGDPSRMAAGYAGVLTMGTQSNDIVIRGNSPNGMLWRMEGLQIPNPNHFGGLTASGGTMSMLNNNVLSNSDFLTGAFPAEFGNALSGVFDLRLRKGNADRQEFLAQVGFNGFEVGVEGPLAEGKDGSYLANYRYSTLGVFDLLGINFGVFAIPKYQDLSFNIDLPKSKLGNISIFGLGGLNSITDETADLPPGEREFFDNSAKVGFVGIKHQYFLSDNASLVTSVGLSHSVNHSLSEQYVSDALEEYTWMEQSESTVELNMVYKNRLNTRNILQFGFDLFNTSFNFQDTVYLQDHRMFSQTVNTSGRVPLVQAHAQWKHRFSDALSMVTGLHYQYAALGNDHSPEPRFSLNWNFLPGQSLSFGAGIHSRLHPKYVYFYEELADTMQQVYTRPNQDLKMTRSRHLVLGYNYAFSNDHRMKIEAYYQHLNQVPVERQASFRSLVNYGTSFSNYEYHGLVNEGTAYNLGAEVTLEKFFSNNFYYLFTMSVFDSRYKGSDGVLRSTRFNTNMIANFLGGYEWTLKERNALSVDTRLMWSGGERKVPLDYAASQEKGEAVYDVERAYTERFMNYFRMDFRLSYKINRKTNHTLAIDIMNVTNRINHYLALYDEDLNDYEEVSALGMLPTFLWRWNF
ncbi:TonB-dependent receptor [Phaeodactylibacter sp.]|uniref:TonB-dependent receptor n=1 Tax=Phaeodactylibacter sp. TaxID=1940289 RepID=UPI0025CFB1E8|nr:TonB-dependent receptor [Phaeodactylibacter sp.]MCI4646711.1 TonB-dependent receptor [Phaeodactylibacter sp.]MCI5089476.1 TonB-dependent receptor [Phaeodactylibacter sp.]